MTLNGRLIGKILSIILLIVAAALLLPGLFGVLYGEGKAAAAFFETAAAAGILGGLGTAFFRPETKRIRIREGLLIATLTWLLAATVGAVPFVLSGAIPSGVDAWFEAMSGITTTGATIIEDIEILPHAVLFWRSLLHWLGGMGILVFAIALLPSLGIGGTQLMAAESTGPTNDKLTAKQSNTAKLLYMIYGGLTASECLLLLAGGMSFFDALNHALSTMGTGGFSTYNASIAAFNSPYIEWVITLFMLLAGVRFPVYFYLIHRESRKIRHDAELLTYLSIWAGATLLIFTILLLSGTYVSSGDAVRHSAFQAASIMSTTGFGIGDYEVWPTAARMIIFALFFVGGSAGSTAGGVKVIRVIAFFKIIRRGLTEKIHPNAVVSIRIGGQPMAEETVSVISTFLFLYFGLCLFGGFVVSFSGASLLTSLAASMSCLGNIGPGFEAIGPVCTYAFFPAWTKLFLAFFMLVGRLELMPVMTLFLPNFWNPNRA